MVDAPPPPWHPSGVTLTPLRRRLLKLAHFALCAVLLVALSPGTSLLVDALARTAHAGHADAGEAGHDETGEGCDSPDCDDCRDHGCTPDQHHCTCCVSIVGLPAELPPAPPVGPQVRASHRERYVWGHLNGPERATPLPVPPPIA